MSSPREKTSSMLKSKLLKVEDLVVRIFKRYRLPSLTANEASILLSTERYEGKKIPPELLAFISIYQSLLLLRKYILAKDMEVSVLYALSLGVNLGIANNIHTDTELNKIKELPSAHAKKSWLDGSKRRKRITNKRQLLINMANKLLSSKPPIPEKRLCKKLADDPSCPYISQKQVSTILKEEGILKSKANEKRNISIRNPDQQ